MSSGTDPIKVLLIDDHPLVIEGLKALLESFDRIAVVGTACQVRDGLACAAATSPAVILMDINMPLIGGIDAITLFRRQVPGARILMLSMHDSREYISAAVVQGAAGYVLKHVPTEEIVAAIEAVAAGGTYFCAGVSAALLGMEPAGEKDAELSPREREVLTLLAGGASNRDIAAGLSLSVATIETHRKNIKKKLAIATTAGLIRYAVERGYIAEQGDLPTSG